MPTPPLRNLILLLGSAVLIIGSAFWYAGCTQQSRSAPSAPSVAVRTAYEDGVQQMDDRLQALYDAVESADSSTASQEELERLFREARLDYKTVEYMTAHQFPTVADLMNGPALPHIAPDDPTHWVVEPEGFQVIEEMIFPAFDPSTRGQLLTEVAIAQANTNRLKMYTHDGAFADRHVFMALRNQVTRVIALGLSGFDSPVALHALPEAATVFQSMKDVLAPYRSQLEAEAPDLAQQLMSTLDDASAYLLRSDHTFDTFDRLHFIIKYANPIARMLYDAQHALDVPGMVAQQPLRDEAKTVFDANAFDPAFFAKPGEGAITEARIELGQLLFHEPLLSGDGQRTCASCHEPDRAFTDGRTKSVAFGKTGTTQRNAPTLINAGLQPSSSYDQTTVLVGQRVEAVINSPVEMHGSFKEAAALLKTSPEYVQHLKAAFDTVGSDAMVARQLRTALADYTRSLVGLNSRFDRYVRGEEAALDAAEKRGFNLFMGKALCGTCHFAPLFNGTVPPAYVDAESEVLGVPTKPDTANAIVDPDEGKFIVHEIEFDRFAFKTPTVRNAALTAPYMHNGAYETLAQVVDFYNRGGGAGIGIDLEHQTLPPDPLELTEQEQQDLVAFMEALTDTTSLNTVPASLPEVPGVQRSAASERY